jgi:hypothetical protein
MSSNKHLSFYAALGARKIMPVANPPLFMALEVVADDLADAGSPRRSRAAESRPGPFGAGYFSDS